MGFYFVQTFAQKITQPRVRALKPQMINARATCNFAAEGCWARWRNLTVGFKTATPHSLLTVLQETLPLVDCACDF
jgi:hypothetical protein